MYQEGESSLVNARLRNFHSPKNTPQHPLEQTNDPATKTNGDVSRATARARSHTNLKIHVSGHFGIARQAPDAAAGLGIGVVDVETVVLRNGYGSITRPETIVPLHVSNALKPVSLEKLDGFQTAGRLQLCNDI
jgi:hypothetical protein